jgi:hypothetical protein
MKVTYVDNPNCPDNQSCLFDRHAYGGTKAAYYQYAVHSANDGGAAVVMYVFEDSRGWHFLNAQGTQNIGAPAVGVTDQPWLSSGCANVRDMPSVKGRVIACLADATLVEIDGGPTFADEHLWWHLRGRGWMAHDFLVPKFIPGGVA